LPLDQRHQHIKGAPAEVDPPTVGEQLAAMRHNPEVAELDVSPVFRTQDP